MSDSWHEELPYFSRSELACRCCGEIRLDMRFAVELPWLRKVAGRPLPLTSVCRCPAHNASVGGHLRSLHLTENPVHPSHGAMAADISTHGWSLDEKAEFAAMAYEFGWSVGLHPDFIHIDLRIALPLPQGVFTYRGWDGFPPGLVTDA
jgi:hypothetical protein